MSAEKIDMDFFNELIDELVDRLINHQKIQSDIAILEDLKRMGNLGVLTVYTTNEPPNIEFSKDGKTVNMSMKVPRLMFTGEEEIIKLKSQTTAKDEQIKKLREALVYARSFIVRADDWYGPDADMGLIDKVLQETEPKNEEGC